MSILAKFYSIKIHSNTANLLSYCAFLNFPVNYIHLGVLMTLGSDVVLCVVSSLTFYSISSSVLSGELVVGTS